MKQHIEIIDGQEVVVKVYAPNPISKKVTAKVRLRIKRRSNRKKSAKKAGV